MLTWYDLLGVEPGAPAAQVQTAYQARLGQLAPGLLSGAPTRVLRAADTARAAADAAWQVLGDPATRQRYDEEIAAWPAGDLYVRGLSGDMVMAGLADLLHVDMVKLTAQPMAVEGLVIDQSPRPGGKVRRAGAVTVQVWHPTRRPS